MQLVIIILVFWFGAFIVSRSIDNKNSGINILAFGRNIILIAGILILDEGMGLEIIGVFLLVVGALISIAGIGRR